MRKTISGMLAVALSAFAFDASAVFVSVDPVQPNPKNGHNFNRYWYGNNNPYKFTDPDGRVVHVAGQPDDQKQLIQQAEKFSGLKITQDSSGNLQSFQCSANQGAASPVLASALISAIGSTSTINLTAVNADPKVYIDQFSTGKIDVADVAGIAAKSPQMGAGALVHTLAEYQAAQGMPGGQVRANFPAAHQIGLAAESKIFGAATRTNSFQGQPLTPGSGITYNYVDATGTTVQSFNYILDQNSTPR